MGRVLGAVVGEVLFRYCEACEGSGVPRAEVEGNEGDGLYG